MNKDALIGFVMYGGILLLGLIGITLFALFVKYIMWPLWVMLGILK